MYDFVEGEQKMKKRLLSTTLVLLLLANLTACSLLPSGGNSEEDSGNIVASTEDASGNQTEVCEHQWIEATCTEPKTCSLCGITEGEPLEHDFAPATVDSPKKCKVCGFEEGDAVKVTEITLPEGFFNKPIYSALNDDFLICADESSDVDGAIYKVGVYDLSGNKLCEDYLYRPEGFSGNQWNYFIASYNGFLYWLFMDDSNKAKLEVYKYNGSELEKIFESDVTTGTYKRTDTFDVLIENEKYYGVSTCGYTVCYDVENNCLCSEDDIVKDEEEIDYDESLWSYYNYNLPIDGYMVGTIDGSSWGYLDKDGNEIAMYTDASDFSPSGYALVREDDSTYSIIDKDFNIVGDRLFEGTGAHTIDNFKSNIFEIEQNDGKVVWIKIE